MKSFDYVIKDPHPAGSEIDASIIYADYYYYEALLRLRRLQQGRPVLGIG